MKYLKIEFHCRNYYLEMHVQNYSKFFVIILDFLRGQS